MNQNIQQVAVVIPMYKAEMNELEQQSFRQCIKILGNYPIIIAKPTSLPLPELTTQYSVQLRDFPDHFFKDIAGYNQLLISPSFYEAFLAFEYILIYQLDAFVFDDQLQAWCSKGYDYIGSPYLAPNQNVGTYYQLRRVLLNGGFSLRKIQACIRFLKVFRGLGQSWNGNEDGLFSLHFIRLRPFEPLLRLPSWQEALAFGFEQHPQFCYQLNHNQLPFGCHAWEKYDYEFWKGFL